MFIDKINRTNSRGEFNCTGFKLVPLIIFIPIRASQNHFNIRYKIGDWEYQLYDSNFKITDEIKFAVENMPIEVGEFGYFKSILSNESGSYFELNYFEKLLSEYLSDEPLIPLDINERKRKFQKAFDES